MRLRLGSRALSGGSVMRRRLQFAAHGHLRPAHGRAAGDHRARPPARAELRASSSEMLDMPESRVRELAREALVDARAGHAPARSTRSGAASSPTTCSASRPAPSPPPPGATCAARRRRAPGRARCSTRSTTSTRTAAARDPRGRARERAAAASARRAAAAARAPCPRRSPRRGRAQPLSPEGRSAVRRAGWPAPAACSPLLLARLLLWPVGAAHGRRRRRRRREQAASKSSSPAPPRAPAPRPAARR